MSHGAMSIALEKSIKEVNQLYNVAKKLFTAWLSFSFKLWTDLNTFVFINKYVKLFYSDFKVAFLRIAQGQQMKMSLSSYLWLIYSLFFCQTNESTDNY